MKNIDRFLIAIILTSLAGCASTPEQPKYFVDEYGIVHTDQPSYEAVSNVAVTIRELPVGCKRLRDVYVDGPREIRLQWEAAAMFGTHVKRMTGLPEGVWGGVVYNCTNWQENESQLASQTKKAMAIAEMEKRRAAQGKGYELREVKPSALNMGYKGQLPKLVKGE